MTYESPSTEEARRASELHRPTTRWRISSPLQRATHTYGMAADTFGWLSWRQKRVAGPIAGSGCSVHYCSVKV